MADTFKAEEIYKMHYERSYVAAYTQTHNRQQISSYGVHCYIRTETCEKYETWDLIAAPIICPNLRLASEVAQLLAHFSVTEVSKNNSQILDFHYDDIDANDWLHNS